MPLSNSKTAGTLLFVGGIQFVLALIIAESIYPNYSVSANYISDLGVWGKSSAVFFNPSIILFGLTILASSYFLQKQFKNRIFTIFFVLTGVGALGAGIFPENTFVVGVVPIFHYLSSFSLIDFGAISILASYMITKPPFKFLSVFLGAFMVIAILLFCMTWNTGGLGIGGGGMERMIVFPTIAWIISLGGYMLGKSD
jgi:hypothetical membrane protein